MNDNLLLYSYAIAGFSIRHFIYYINSQKEQLLYYDLQMEDNA